MRKTLILALALLSFQSLAASLGKATCRGSLWKNQASVRRDIELMGKAFGIIDPNNRYEQNYYGIEKYNLTASGNLQGVRTGESGFNKYKYIVEIGVTMVKAWEISVPHHDPKEIRHYGECVLDRPLSGAQFETLKRSLL